MRKSFWGFLFINVAAVGQTPPAFEVASIRPAGPLEAMAASGKMHIGMHIDGARVDIGSLSLSDLITIAYKVKRYQVTGPSWMGVQRFDIMAKMPEGATKEQVPEMLQALLAERFKLTIHRDNKEQSVYALVVGKNGAKLKESPPDPAPAPGDDPTAANADTQPKIKMDAAKGGAVITGGATGTTKVAMGANGTLHFEMEKMPLSALAEFLSRFMEKPVIDMTELKGNYQVAMDLSMDDLRTIARSAGVMIPGGGPGGEPGKAPDAAADPSGSSIFSTIQQFGLRLDSRKAPVEMIVIDHLEKAPTEN